MGGRSPRPVPAPSPTVPPGLSFPHPTAATRRTTSFLGALLVPSIPSSRRPRRRTPLLLPLSSSQTMTKKSSWRVWTTLRLWPASTWPGFKNWRSRRRCSYLRLRLSRLRSRMSGTQTLCCAGHSMRLLAQLPPLRRALSLSPALALLQPTFRQRPLVATLWSLPHIPRRHASCPRFPPARRLASHTTRTCKRLSPPTALTTTGIPSEC
ncbi:hypothetical protein B0H10DRAFT_2147360 [Mycena sp. CBHHK59/15]|nr:hypothetical protein B0H10DRAFT_2147360 [Mycena sp. CBHHK59/15]